MKEKRSLSILVILLIIVNVVLLLMTSVSVIKSINNILENKEKQSIEVYGDMEEQLLTDEI